MNDGIRLLLIGIGGVFLIGLLSNRAEKKEPNLQQWVNRLIEHVDHVYINEAVKRFGFLVESGIEPALAFEMTINS